MVLDLNGRPDQLGLCVYWFVDCPSSKKKSEICCMLVFQVFQSYWDGAGDCIGGFGPFQPRLPCGKAPLSHSFYRLHVPIWHTCERSNLFILFRPLINKKKDFLMICWSHLSQHLVHFTCVAHLREREDGRCGREGWCRPDVSMPIVHCIVACCICLTSISAM